MYYRVSTEIWRPSIIPVEFPPTEQRTEISSNTYQPAMITTSNTSYQSPVKVSLQHDKQVSEKHRRQIKKIVPAKVKSIGKMFFQKGCGLLHGLNTHFHALLGGKTCVYTRFDVTFRSLANHSLLRC